MDAGRVLSVSGNACHMSLLPVHDHLLPDV